MLKNIWPFTKWYQLNHRIKYLESIIEKQNEKLVEYEQRIQGQRKILEQLKDKMDIVNKKLLSLESEQDNKISIINDEISKYYNCFQKLEKEINEINTDFVKYKQFLNDDIWFTKYGYDWMISDLQMRCIEEILPGNREKLLSLKNTHVGEACFVIGNGPSLRAEDLSKLKENNIFCFASKRINLIFDKTDWRPDIWGVSDLDYIQLYKDEISELKGFPKLVCAQSIIKHDIIIEDAIYYPFIQMERQPPWFNEDIMRGVHFWGTITCKLINFAVYMGFKKIYLLGVDNTFPINKDENGNYICDPSQSKHFSEDYHSRDEAKEVLKNIDDILKSQEYVNKSYNSIKWHCEQLGVEVINATRRGELEIFTRKHFEEILEEGL